MGVMADAARAAGGKVTGITPQILVHQGIADELCDELIVTEGMRERKALLEEHGDAFIALPGGLGTFEEVFEILVSKVLGCHKKPIIFLNVSGYYAPLLAMIEHGIEQRFIKASSRKAYNVVESAAEVIAFLKSHGTATQHLPDRIGVLAGPAPDVADPVCRNQQTAYANSSGIASASADATDNRARGSADGRLSGHGR